MTIGRETTGNYSNADTDWKKLQAGKQEVSDWYKLANCVGEDPELFSVGPGSSEASISAAKAICKKCIVRQDCLNDAIATNEKYTVRGGFTPKEWAKLPATKQGVPVTEKEIEAHDAYIYAQGRARNKR